MDIIQMGAQLLADKLGTSLDAGSIGSALGKLLANEAGELDLAGLAGKMAANGDLGGIINSWLGDGANDAISADSIMGIFGSDKIGEFAAQLGVDSDAAAGGLAEVLPQVMDKASSGGNLMDMMGGASGLLGAAKGLFG